MHRILSLSLALALAASAIPSVSASGELTGRIRGVAWTQGGLYLANHGARVRDLDSGRLAGATTTSPSGEFMFLGLDPGVYIVELIRDGAVVGTSAPVVLTRRSLIADRVSATAAAARAPGVFSGAFWTSTAGIITLAAISAGVLTAVVVAQNDASPSR